MHIVSLNLNNDAERAGSLKREMFVLAQMTESEK